MITTGIGTLPTRPARYRITKIKAPNRIAAIMLEILKEADSFDFRPPQAIETGKIPAASNIWRTITTANKSVAAFAVVTMTWVLDKKSIMFSHSLGLSFFKIPERICILGHLIIRYNLFHGYHAAYHPPILDYCLTNKREANPHDKHGLLCYF